MAQLNCIAIDDEEFDLLLTVSCINRVSLFNLKGSFGNVRSAMDVIDFSDIDVLFLDIDLPGLNGLQFREKMKEVPVCVFITSHPEYALDSYSVETLDFIVKPLTLERFKQSAEKIELFMNLRKKADLYENYIGADHIIIKEGYQETKIPIHEILYLEALKDYTMIKTENKDFFVLALLGKLLKEKSFQQFVRVHRSYAVRKDAVKTKNAYEITLNNDKKIAVGPSYKDNLKLIFD